VPHDIRIDRSVAAEGTAVEGDSWKGRTGVIFNSDITTEQGGYVPQGRRRSRERDVHIAGSYSVSEHRIRCRRVREERGRQGSIAVSRGKVGSTPRTRAGDHILLESRTGKAISSGFRIQRLLPYRRRPEKEEGHFAVIDRADRVGVYGNERIRRRHQHTNDPGSNPRRCTKGIEVIQPGERQGRQGRTG
jgi:hypothetical protein